MTEKRILLLSFYYRPDLCAGSFRATALVEALLGQVCPNTKIDVITTLPNRYASFDSKAQSLESNGQLTIHRIKLPTHHSGMIDQAKAFFHFARTASELAKRQPYDLVIATSSRLMTAVLGARVASRTSTPLYLDIRDIFVDTIKDVLPKKAALLLKPLFSVAERWTVDRATHVNLVSKGFKPYFNARYPGQSFSFYTNGIDDEFLGQKPTVTNAREPTSPINVLYAGNMGEGQGLHAIIPALATQLGDRVKFKLIGDGGRRAQLEKSLSEMGSNNVQLMAPMPREILIKEYLAADVLFLHLNDYDAFKKVLPSKIFEYAALGKPIWAGVAGYAAQFLREEVTNAAVFAPCDAEGATDALAKLSIGDTPRAAFVAKFTRAQIMREMATDVLRHMKPESRA